MSAGPAPSRSLGDTALPELRGALAGSGIVLDLGLATLRVRSDLPLLAAQLRAVYPHFGFHPAGEWADLHVDIVRPRGLRRGWRPQAVFRCDGRTPFDPFPADSPLPLLEWGTNWLIGRRLNGHLLLHAGAVERDGVALLLPATPGSGKSTLAAALALHGWRLLSDEFGALDPGSGMLHPVLKPVALKNESIDVIRRWSPAAVIGPAFPNTRKGTVAHLAAGADAAARVHEPALAAAVVLPRWQAGAPTTWERIEPQTVFRALAFNAFNYPVTGEEGFAAVACIARACPAWELVYSDLHEAVDRIERDWGDVVAAARQHAPDAGVGDAALSCARVTGASAAVHATDAASRSGWEASPTDASAAAAAAARIARVTPAGPAAAPVATGVATGGPDAAQSEPASVRVSAGSIPPHLAWLAALRDPAQAVRWTAADWDRAVRLARRLRLLARLGEALDAAGMLAQVPPAAARHLRAEMRQARWQTRALAWLAERAGAALDGAPYPRVLLKGAAYVADGLALGRGRLPSDLDILVPQADLADAQARLAAAGWSELALDAHDRRYYHEWSHEAPPMRHPAHPLELDLHHNILPPVARLSVDAERLLAHVRPSGWPGWQALDPLDQILHSAAHLFQDPDLTDRLRDLADLDALCRLHAGGADFWPALLHRARELGLGQPLWLALHFLRAWFALPVPQDAALDALGPPRWQRGALLALLRTVLTPIEPDAAPGAARGLAERAWLLRHHLGRMPLRLLLPHAWHKLRAPGKAAAAAGGGAPRPMKVDEAA